MLRRAARKMSSSSAATFATTYPPARRDSSSGDTLHGVWVPDPYRWLEDPDSDETRAWVQSQVAHTGAYFSRDASTRDRLRARLQQLQCYQRVGCPSVRGAHAFLLRNTGLQNQDVLLRIPASVVFAHGASGDSALAAATPLLDLNADHPDGTTALSCSALSEDGALLAYGLSHGGSDWQTLRVRRVADCTELPDEVPWAKFTRPAWLHDGSGFFYCRHAPPHAPAGGGAGTETAATQHAMVCFHRLGTHAVTQDVLVHALPSQPVWRFGVEVSDDGAYLLVTTHKGTDPVNRLAYCHIPSVWPGWLAAAAAAADAAAASGAGGAPPTPPPHFQPGGVPPAPGHHAYLPLVRVVDSWAADFEYVANDGARFYLKTNAGAPRYRVVVADFPPDAPHTAEPHASDDVDAPLPPLRDALPQEPAGDVLEWAAPVGGDFLLTCAKRDVVSVLRLALLPPRGAPPPPLAAALPLPSSAVPLPGPGTIAAFSGRRDQPVAFAKFVSFTAPGTILRLELLPEGGQLANGDAAAGGAAGGAAGFAADVPHPLAGARTAAARLSTFHETTLPGFDPAEYEAVQQFVPSLDGAVKLPLFVVHRRPPPGAPLPPPPAPTLLYGYGGFNVSLGPTFSALRLLWLQELGGVFALAILRGGGEYGEEWHAGGQRLRKQNVFDDFHACAAHLRATRVASTLGAMGGSNGGLLTLACALQRPALYDAVVSQVPVTDMTRFHRFTVGALWRGEYGFVEDDAADLACVLRYSPLHNVRAPAAPGDGLPAVLITTADHDDRVSPLHSYKAAAELQAVAGPSPHQARPLLIRVETQAGHGAGKPTAKVLDEAADTWAFLTRELGVAAATGGAAAGVGGEA